MVSWWLTFVVDSLIGSSRAEAATKLQLTRLMPGSLSGHGARAI
jgi:hypothetical protein